MSPDFSSFNPFPGLRHFEFDETALFFGRDGQSDEVLRRLRMHRFLAVIGTSGSGKSSLIRAGVLPAIYGGMMVQAGSRWRHAILRPGDDPIGQLSCALGRKGVFGREEEDALETPLIESALRSSGLGLIDAARLAHLPPRENLVVIIDQFEELFRFAGAARSMHREDDAAAFVKLLLEATRQEELPIYVIITMRSDFIGDCARFRDLAEAVNDGMYLIPRMTRDQRKEAIRGPIAVGGAEIAPRLVNRLLNDVGDNPDQLPIMQHALMRTWDCWQRDHQPDEPLDLRHYEAVGGMAEALSRHAEEAYAELPNERHRNIAKRLFQSLTDKGGDNREVRRPTRIAEILERAHVDLAEVLATVECFRRPGRSFLMPPSEIPLGEQSIVDISHESLIRGWRRLSDWVQEESTSAETFRRLAETAAYYAHGQAAFLTNPELSVALAWREREWPTSAWARRYRGDFDEAMQFLKESDAAYRAEEVERERQRVSALRRLQVFAGVVLVAFLAAAGLGGVSLIERSRLKDRNAVIEKQKTAAEEETRQLRVAETEKSHALEVANQKTQEAETQRAEAVRQRAAAEEGQREAELSANILHDEVLASRKKQVQDAEVMNGLAQRLEVRSPKMYGTLALLGREQGLTETGDHKAAIDQLNKILEIQPDNLEALFGRGYEYLLLDQPEKSIADSKKYLAENPQSSNALENLALAEAMIRQYAAARSDTYRAIETYSPTVDDGMIESELAPGLQEATGHKLLIASGPAYLVALYYELAAIDAMSGDPRFAQDLKTAEDKAEKYPNSPNPYQVALDWAWLESRHLPDYGISAFLGAMWEKLADNNPHFRRWAFEQYLRFEADDAKLHDPRYRELAKWVRQRLAGLGAPPREEVGKPNVVELRAKAEELQYRIGDSTDLMQLAAVKSKLDAAIQMARQSGRAAGAPHDLLVELLVLRIKVKNASGDIPSMRVDCKEILSLDPHNPTAEYLLAVHEADDAAKRRYFEAALADNPVDSDVLRDYSRYLAGKEDDASLAEALKLVKLRIRLEPYSTDAHYDLARLEHRLHHDDKALESIDTMLAIDPEISWYYEEREEIEASIADRKQLADLRLARGYLTAGNALSFLDRPDEAFAEYTQALNAAASLPDQKNEDVIFQVGLAARAITDFLMTRSSPEEVAQFWQAAAASTKNATVAQQANRELDRLKLDKAGN